MSKRWRWLLTAVLATVVAAVVTRPVNACFTTVFSPPPPPIPYWLFGGGGADGCAPPTSVSNATQVAHLVTQLGHMVEQLARMQSIDEILTTHKPGVGNMGRLREVNDLSWWLMRDGRGLATDAQGEGAFNQRIPGVTDEAGWLGVLAAPRLGDPTANTVLLGGRPATETSAAEPSAFRTWRVPRDPAWSNPGRAAAREAIEVLGDVAEGAATWRMVWDGLEAVLPNAVRPADVRALNLEQALEARVNDGWRRRERRAGADLQHAHAIGEASSTLNVQIGETAAHLAELRDDDLMRVQRVDQAVLASGVTKTELLLAVAQVRAQEQATAARARYEGERRRREELARWHAEMAASEADWQALRSDIAAQRGARTAARRRLPDPSTW